MKHITILSDLDSVHIKIVPDELYDRILRFVNPENYKFPSFQILYDNLCEDEPNEVGEKLWEELLSCNNLESDVIQEY